MTILSLYIFVSRLVLSIGLFILQLFFLPHFILSAGISHFMRPVTTFTFVYICTFQFKV